MVRTFAKTLLLRFADWKLFRAFEGLWYRTVRVSPSTKRDGVLVVATPGSGNIGDQAMFESFLRNTCGKIMAVFARTNALTVPDDLTGRVETHVLEGLFQGRPQLSPVLIRKFGRLLNRSERFVIIGADIVDGAYGFRQAWSYTEGLRLAVRMGIPARVVGFSWSSQPHPAIERAYERLSSHVGLVTRDKYSHGRLESAGIRARIAPDTVFSLKYRCDAGNSPPPMRSLRNGVANPTALLNISGLLRSRHSLVDQYISIVRELRKLGYAVVLMPHVFRAGDDDVAAMYEVKASLGNMEVEVVEEALTPNQVQTLAASAALVITGRMHLAILALTVGTPVIVFGSQGKVEGMLAWLGLEDLTVQPGPNLATNTIACIHDVHENYDRVREQISKELPKVVEGASANFTW